MVISSTNSLYGNTLILNIKYFDKFVAKFTVTATYTESNV